jgi:GH24 family phage-related lysozyme (muramidase)
MSEAYQYLGYKKGDFPIAEEYANEVLSLPIYNGMTEDEAFAYLVSTVNDSGYTSNLNNTLTKYKIKFNQAQFDALLDFSYNLGAYAISNYSDLLGVLTNSYGKASYAKKAFTNAAGVVLRASASTSAKSLSTLSAYTTVTLVNTKLYGDSFYYVKLKNGTKGYIKSAYLTRRSNDTKVRNLKNVTLTDFRNTYMDYHHASGSCYWGLVYRRLDELEQFFFNDYALDGSLNKFHIKYTCPQNSNTYID